MEFTESALMRKPEVVRQQLGRLREMGVEVAIDDFGSGYSNWNYLRALPASSVKLDRSLLRDLADPADRRLTRTIIELARELGYRVVAEGIETPETQALVHAWAATRARASCSPADAGHGAGRLAGGAGRTAGLSR